MPLLVLDISQSTRPLPSDPSDPQSRVSPKNLLKLYMTCEKIDYDEKDDPWERLQDPYGSVVVLRDKM